MTHSYVCQEDFRGPVSNENIDVFFTSLLLRHTPHPESSPILARKSRVEYSALDYRLGLLTLDCPPSSSPPPCGELSWHLMRRLLQKEAFLRITPAEAQAQLIRTTRVEHQSSDANTTSAATSPSSSIPGKSAGRWDSPQQEQRDTLQHAATRNAVCRDSRVGVLAQGRAEPHTATRCNTPQHTATHSNSPLGAMAQVKAELSILEGEYVQVTEQVRFLKSQLCSHIIQ